MLEVIRDLHRAIGDGDLSLRDVTSHFIERHAQEVEYKITPKWVGGLIRKRLGLHTMRTREGYIIPTSETPKLEQLYTKYGLTADTEEPEPPPVPPEPPWWTFRSSRGAFLAPNRGMDTRAFGCERA